MYAYRSKTLDDPLLICQRTATVEFALDGDATCQSECQLLILQTMDSSFIIFPVFGLVVCVWTVEEPNVPKLGFDAQTPAW